MTREICLKYKIVHNAGRVDEEKSFSFSPNTRTMDHLMKPTGRRDLGGQNEILLHTVH